MPDRVEAGDPSRPTVRLLSYNIQVGIHTTSRAGYLTHGWKHFVPHAGRGRNLDRIAQVLAGHDIVGLQETDAGSMRSGFVNLTEYLARKAGFPYWHHKINRKFGQFAQHAHGLISRIAPASVDAHELPGLIPGRGVIVARYGAGDDALAVFHVHLALTSRARRTQFGFIAEMMQDHPHAVLMGDFNCRPGSPEMVELFRRTGLREPETVLHTFPSWRPEHDIDHVLVTPSLDVVDAKVLPHAFSDHLPLSVEVALPKGSQIASTAE
jgi:endonuclease/exonuclease/phosphatase family metal-dependent hydrolase